MHQKLYFPIICSLFIDLKPKGVNMSFISSAYAEVTQAATTANENPLMNLLPLVLIFAVFYVFLIRPQQKKLKEQQAIINAIKRGDEVVTGGGIIGKVSKIEENSNIAHIEIADGVQVRVNKATIIEVIAKTGSADIIEKPASKNKKEKTKKIKAS